MNSIRQSMGERAAAAQPNSAMKPGLDARTLGNGSLVALLITGLNWALGGATISLAILVCVAIGPWVTAFLMHKGPHRVRRVVAVLVVLLVIKGCRNAVAAVRTAARRSGGQPADRHGATDDRHGATSDEMAGARRRANRTRRISAAEERLARAWLREVTRVGAVCFVVVAGVFALSVAVRDRMSASAASELTLHVPPRGVRTQAGDRTAVRVTYHVTATDGEQALVPVCNPPSGSLFSIGETRVQCSVTDGAARRAQADFLVTVSRGGQPPALDRRAPALTVPDDVTHATTSASGARVTYAASARDLRDGALTPDCQPASGSVFALGRTRVACTAIDAAGNTARARFTVTVTSGGDASRERHDGSPPDPNTADRSPRSHSQPDRPATRGSEADGPTPSGRTPLPTTAPNPSDPTPVNAGREQLSQSSADETPPSIKVPDPMKVAGTTKQGAKVTYSASATDDRDGDLKPSCDPDSGAVFAYGTTTVTCSARDAAGNRAKKSFAVTVTDQTPPVVSVPTAIKTDGVAPQGTKVPDFDVSAIDNRDGAITPTCDRGPGLFGYGTTTVTCSAHDAAGNTAARKFPVTIVDTPPVLRVPTEPVVRQCCPEIDYARDLGVTAFDARDGKLDFVCKPPSGTQFVGKSVVSCTARDAAGQTTRASFEIRTYIP